MPAYSLPSAPVVLADLPSQPLECSPTATALTAEARSFGAVLEPRYIFRAIPFDQ